MPRNRYDTLPKIVSPPKMQDGRGNTFLPIFCDQFQYCSLPQTKTTLYVILHLILYYPNPLGTRGRQGHCRDRAGCL